MSRAEQRWFAGAAAGLWLLFLVQALWTPVLLDDWFPLRYWRDHAFGISELWAYARHDYFHYNPRIGEVFLAAVDGSRALHVIVTPLVQLALLPAVFVIAFGRWPRRTMRDLQLLLFIQVMIWLVIPIPGIMYFYRPFATNYLWGFTITLALFVPYRLAHADRPRLWLAPIVFVIGWTAGMCNEHTGPTAMVAIAGFVYAAWRRRELRAWMVAGLVGLYVGYPMLFFAPGQSVRYGGLATRDTPARLLAERGLTGCLAILWDFFYECRLGILLVAAALVRHALTRRHQADWPPRRVRVTAGVLAGAASAIVVTLFFSPTTTDRVFFASGVLLVAAFAVWIEHLFGEPGVRRFTVAACLVVFGYHVVRFVEVGLVTKGENDERLALLAAAPPGSVAVVPRYTYASHSRWFPGEDFIYFPWLGAYVGGELHDLATVDLDRFEGAPPPRSIATWTYASAPRVRRDAPTYRELQRLPDHTSLALRHGPARALSIVTTGVFVDPAHRPLYMLAWTADGERFVDGRPDDESAGHFIRVRRATWPDPVEETYVVGCTITERVEPV
ncbi:MAG: DUF6056 family protein, partial [Kofleriaceae bacterium]